MSRMVFRAMARLIEGGNDGYVLSGLTVNKYGDRANVLRATVVGN